MTPRLSRREMEVARLVAEGLSDRQIAARLFISERTAEGHLQQIRNKLGLDTRSQVAVWVASQSVPGVAGGVPPVDQPAPVRPNNLPVQLTTFIGRERDIAEVRRLLNRSRLVTITGPGGSGKTRLAIQAAAENLYRYQDGVWFVDLSPISDPNSLPQAVASVLAVHEREQADLISAIGLHLNDSRCRVRCLVILDNCEQVVEGCAGMADALLRACPQLGILCTSREALQIPGEAIWNLPPMTLPEAGGPSSPEQVVRSDAVKLLVDRGSLSDPSFELTEANAGTVAELCRRLDGMPLALELAAARLGLTPVEALLEHLDDHFNLLRSRVPVARQRTIRATIDWSYELLSEDERTLFRRLAVFRGGFTVDAVNQVCAGADSDAARTFEGLSRLVDRSLVVADGRTDRYRLLEPIRRYALERLSESVERDAVMQRQHDYFLRLAERSAVAMRGPDQPAWLERLSAEHDNLRAALDWSRTQDEETRLRLVLALTRFWYVRGHLSEARQRFEAVLAGVQDPSPGRAQALSDAAGFAWRQGDQESARTGLEDALSIWRLLDERAGIQTSLANLGVLATSRGEYTLAQQLLEESLDLARGMGDEHGQAIVTENLGHLAVLVAEYERAQTYLDSALAIKQRLGEPARLTLTLVNLGILAALRDRPSDARAHLAECLDLLETTGDAGNGAECLAAVAWLVWRADRPAEALRLAGAAAGVWETIGAPPSPESERLMDRWIGSAREAVGAVRADDARASGAALTANQAIALARDEISKT